jgi:hypothetical protein
VLRVLITCMSDFGSVPLSKRLPPAHLREENKAQLLPLAQTAVACLQVGSTAVHHKGLVQWSYTLAKLTGDFN